MPRNDPFATSCEVYLLRGLLAILLSSQRKVNYETKYVVLLWGGYDSYCQLARQQCLINRQAGLVTSEHCQDYANI